MYLQDCHHLLGVRNRRSQGLCREDTLAALPRGLRHAGATAEDAVKSRRHHHLDIYTPTFRRAMIAYTNNGFFERDLDAEDWAFIEHIRERGSVGCGAIGSSAWGPPSYYTRDRHPVLPDELDYWTQPFSIAPGPAPRQVVVVKPLPKDVAERKAYLAKRRADKEAAKRELRLARQQWEAEQRKLEQERLERIKRWGLEEVEWAYPAGESELQKQARLTRQRARETRKRIKKHRADKKLWHKVQPPPRPPPKPPREREWLPPEPTGQRES